MVSLLTVVTILSRFLLGLAQVGLGSGGLVYRFIINVSKIYSRDADNDAGKMFPINNRDCQLISWGPN